MKNGAGLEVGIVGGESTLTYRSIFSTERRRLDAIVQSVGWAWRIDAQMFRNQSEQVTPLRDRSLRRMMAHHGQVIGMAACHSRHYTGQRLARWRLKAHDRAEVDAFPITHEAISAMLGMRRNGVANAAVVLWWAEVIAYSRGHVVIRDRPALEALACQCYRHIRLGEDRLLCGLGEAERLAN